MGLEVEITQLFCQTNYKFSSHFSHYKSTSLRPELLTQRSIMPHKRLKRHRQRNRQLRPRTGPTTPPPVLLPLRSRGTSRGNSRASSRTPWTSTRSFRTITTATMQVNSSSNNNNSSSSNNNNISSSKYNSTAVLTPRCLTTLAGRLRRCYPQKRNTCSIGDHR